MKTVSMQAFKCNRDGDFLLSINNGLPVDDALGMASLFLDSVIGLLDGVDAEERSHVTESAIYLATLAKAAIDAAGSAHEH